MNRVFGQHSDLYQLPMAWSLTNSPASNMRITASRRVQWAPHYKPTSSPSLTISTKTRLACEPCRAPKHSKPAIRKTVPNQVPQATPPRDSRLAANQGTNPRSSSDEPHPKRASIQNARSMQQTTLLMRCCLPKEPRSLLQQWQLLKDKHFPPRLVKP